MADNQDITIGMLLEHMRGMERRILQQLGGRIDSLEKRLDGKIDSLAKRLDGKIDGVEAKLVNLKGSLDTIGQHLDDIEIEFLPKRVTKLEKAVFRSS